MLEFVTTTFLVFYDFFLDIPYVICYSVTTMYIDQCTYFRGSKTYRRVLLRTASRENGKIKRRTLANLSQCTEEELEALKIALKHRKHLSVLQHLSEGTYTSGKIVGPVAMLSQVAEHLGIQKALGHSRQALLVLWLVLARLIHQGSRLSAVRLAQHHAVCELLGLDAFNEDALYQAMDWLSEHKEKIEERVFRYGPPQHSAAQGPQIFLYDVTSTYLEGHHNAFAEYGYNRDKKKGKKQLVYGVLTDAQGDPVAVEAFKGNTRDHQTLAVQILRLKERFGCQYITIVGDKGVLKSGQINELARVGFHYITTITKPQIETLLKRGVLNMGLFDDTLCEIEDPEASLRYILRRNPHRAEEMQQTRDSKIEAVRRKIAEANEYLTAHPRAKVATQIKELTPYVARLKIDRYARIEGDPSLKQVRLRIEKEVLEEARNLDGCYVIKTDLSKDLADKELVHQRYKALSEVEWAFRTEKTGFLEVRPVYVRKKERTVAHLLVVMLAYKIERHLRAAWADLNLTVEEGIETLSKIGSVVITLGETTLIRVPYPDQACQDLLQRARVTLPERLPSREGHVATTKQLQKRRKKK